MADGTVQLVVQADDFGMCHAVNVGIVEAFTNGIVQQASVMAPCPWFDEAARLARRHEIPIGLHETLTCEWEHYRWRPLTGGEFPKTVAGAVEGIPEEVAATELLAQADRVAGAGLTITYLDVHMGLSKPNAYEAVAARTGAPFLYPGVSVSLPFASIWQMSGYDEETKRAKLFRRLERIAGEPGVHLIFGHPAVPSDELRGMTPQDAFNAPWTEEYRLTDLALLTDPDVRDRIEGLGIVLTPVRDASF